MIFLFRKVLNDLGRALFFLSHFCFLFSCGVPDKSVTPEKLAEGSTVSDSPKITEEMKFSPDSSLFPVIEKPFMIARGSEPGWFASIYYDSICVDLDHGSIKRTFRHEFRDMDVEHYKAKLSNQYFNGKERIMDELHISVEHVACTEEASGERRERKIELRFNGKTYHGCATAEL